MSNTIVTEHVSSFNVRTRGGSTSNSGVLHDWYPMGSAEESQVSSGERAENASEFYWDSTV